MTAIFGYIGKEDERLLDRMRAALAHRLHGPTRRTRSAYGDRATFEAGSGDFVQEEERYACAFNGVLFGYKPFGERCQKRNATFARIAQAPESRIDGLKGAFTCSFSTYEATYLYRDGSGTKALYWTKTPDRLLFASEIKALFADPDVKRALRTSAVAEYLSFSFIPGERTMMQGVYELQPGHLLRCSPDGDITTARLFDFESDEYDGPANPEDESGHVERVSAAFRQSVDDCLKAAPHYPAFFLSGGVDSSAVMAVARDLQQGAPSKTFSIHFGEGYPNENDFARLMLDRYPSEHEWVEIRPERFESSFRRIVWMLDDPIGDPVTAPNYLMAQQAARSGVSVALNGEGGDPCFGGPKNLPMMLSRLYRLDEGPRYEEEQYLRSYRRGYDDLDRLLTPEAFAAEGGREALQDILTPFFRSERPKSFLNKLMAINIRLKGANLILPKVDKMTSANGLLALAPLFSERIVRESFRCPPSLKLHGNVEKWALKRSVHSLVPSEIIERPKSGMRVPVRFWFREEMRRFARRALSRKSIREGGLFDPDYVSKLVRYEPLGAHADRHGLKLWMLLTFALWHEQMIQTSPTDFDDTKTHAKWYDPLLDTAKALSPV